MDLLKALFEQQVALVDQANAVPAPHRPEMLYFGCVDARLDPINDIGIPKGHALIHRNIAALISPASAEDASIGAVLEFFLNHIPSPKDGPKHIVVAGHTDCGGLKACCAQPFTNKDLALPLYLERLSGLRCQIVQQSEDQNWNDQKRMEQFEQGSIRQSVKNLFTYTVVKQAVAESRVKVHGWLIDTATHKMKALDHETGRFVPLTEMPLPALKTA